MNRKKTMYMLTLFFVVLMALTACGEKPYEPQPINEETDVCVHCKMAIEDGPFATQIITKDRQSLKFDDIGCMNEWKQEFGTDSIGAQFVRDYHTLEWIAYEEAYYVHDPSFQTPMAYGIVSFAKESDALAFIAEHGKGTLMTAEDLAHHSWERNRELMEGHHDHSHGGHSDM
jgi:copper chaperone NosL